MNALAAPVARPPAQGGCPLPDGELSLHDLLDLFEPEEPGPAGPAARSRTGLRVRLHSWVARAAAWGSGPQGAWRAW